MESVACLPGLACLVLPCLALACLALPWLIYKIRSFWKRSKCDVVAFSTCLRLNIFTFFMVRNSRRTGSRLVGWGPTVSGLRSDERFIWTSVGCVCRCCSRRCCCNRVVSISIITKVSNLIPIWRPWGIGIELTEICPLQMSNASNRCNGSSNSSSHWMLALSFSLWENLWSEHWAFNWNLEITGQRQLPCRTDRWLSQVITLS